MSRRPLVDPMAVAVAAGPDLVITVRDLVALGVPARTIARRCRPGGPWTRLLPGVVLLATGTPTRRQRLRAALLYAGPAAMLTGFAACRIHGLRRIPDDGTVHALVPHDRQRSSRGTVRVERTTRVPTPWTRDGLPVAPIPRAVLDGARTMSLRDDVRALVSDAVQRRLTTPSQLGRELRAGSQRGSAAVREVLVEVGDGVRSAAEGWAHDAVRVSSLPPALWNPRLFLPEGTFLACPDAYWEDVGLAWQLDSVEWHLDPEAYVETLRRRSSMQSHAILVVSTPPRALRTRPGEVIEELVMMYRTAATLPVPEVRVEPVLDVRAQR